jgi:hypothetical protein
VGIDTEEISNVCHDDVPGNPCRPGHEFEILSTEAAEPNSDRENSSDSPFQDAEL